MVFLLAGSVGKGFGDGRWWFVVTKELRFTVGVFDVGGSKSNADLNQPLDFCVDEETD